MNLSLDVGLSKETHRDKVWDVVVIGSGPAGLSAALYASRAHLDTLVLTGEAIGGQVSLTNEVDNYPGTSRRHLTQRSLRSQLRRGSCSINSWSDEASLAYFSRDAPHCGGAWVRGKEGRCGRRWLASATSVDLSQFFVLESYVKILDAADR